MLDRLRKSDYVRNLRITGTGVALTALLGLITSPILSRIFTPEAYGVAGLYSSTVVMLERFSMLMLPTALVVVRKKRDLYRLISAIKWLLMVSVGICVLAVLFFKAPIQRLLNDDSNGLWLYLLPPGLLGAGIATFVNNMNVRGKRFGVNSRAQVFSNLLTRLGNILGGWLTQGYYLIIVLTDLLAVVPRLSVQGVRHLKKIGRIPASWENLRTVLPRYKDYPLFMLPGNLLAALSGRAPLFIFTIFYNPQIAGLYLFSSGMLQIPVLFLHRTIEPVYLQKIADLYHKADRPFRRVTKLTNAGLFAIGLIPFALLTVYGPEIFSWVFSARWEQSGVIAQYLSVFYLFRLSTQPLSPIYRVANREKASFVTQLLLFGLRLGPLLIGLLYFELKIALLLFAIGGTLGYLFHFHQMMRIAGLSFFRPVLLQLLAFGVLCGGLFWLKGS